MYKDKPFCRHTNPDTNIVNYSFIGITIDYTTYTECFATYNRTGFTLFIAQLYLGGVNTFYQDGITVRKNFIGCIENFVWNGIHMTRDKDLAPRFETFGDVLNNCPVCITYDSLDNMYNCNMVPMG